MIYSGQCWTAVDGRSKWRGQPTPPPRPTFRVGQHVALRRALRRGPLDYCSGHVAVVLAVADASGAVSVDLNGLWPAPVKGERRVGAATLPAHELIALDVETYG